MSVYSQVRLSADQLEKLDSKGCRVGQH